MGEEEGEEGKEKEKEEAEEEEEEEKEEEEEWGRRRRRRKIQEGKTGLEPPRPRPSANNKYSQRHNEWGRGRNGKGRPLLAGPCRCRTMELRGIARRQEFTGG